MRLTGMRPIPLSESQEAPSSAGHVSSRREMPMLLAATSSTPKENRGSTCACTSIICTLKQNGPPANTFGCSDGRLAGDFSCRLPDLGPAFAAGEPRGLGGAARPLCGTVAQVGKKLASRQRAPGRGRSRQLVAMNVRRGRRRRAGHFLVGRLTGPVLTAAKCAEVGRGSRSRRGLRGQHLQGPRRSWIRAKVPPLQCKDWEGPGQALASEQTVKLRAGNHPPTSRLRGIRGDLRQARAPRC